jgi:GNAT superfamily N-acetyltransferase
LALGGVRRGQVEAVRVASHRRGEGIGEAMLEWAVARCRREGCGLVQLMTDRERGDAHRFYDRLGFQASHLGYKLRL